MASLKAQTWSEHVATIIYKNCSSCHKEGGIAPIALTSYENVFLHRFSIKSAVTGKHMPPWPPDPSYTTFTDQRILTPTEISSIVSWVDKGAPRGNTAIEPEPPTSKTGNLGTPDKILKMPTFTSTAVDRDIYQCFVLPTDLSTDKILSAIEVVPGNRSIVHHVLVYQDTTANKKARKLDAASAEPGYTSFGGIGVPSAPMLNAWVPGTVTRRLPAAFGNRLYKNSDIVIQVHYPAGSAGKQDSTKVNLYFNNNAQAREVYLQPVLNHSSTLTNGPLFIPANTVKSFNAAYTTPAGISVSVLSVAPHMHLIGESIQVWGNKAVNNDTIRLIKIPHWDFHWQGDYQFQKPVVLPPKTKLQAKIVYNNTTSNPHNPVNPPVDVRLGEGTTDEMMLVYFAYTPYQPGDENIILDSSLLVTEIPTQHHHHGNELKFFPNPVASWLQFVNPHPHETAELIIWDITGRIILKRKLNHDYFVQIPTKNLPNGFYRAGLKTSEGMSRGSFVIKN
ncbi:MAG: T9SS type A sorting domain-containing protein [Bacteroidetes bacterium]|nr:T9SS type A sorting domain-containing protein [Bacteroidota bacterium]